jgi:hypothetical protein
MDFLGFYPALWDFTGWKWISLLFLSFSFVLRCFSFRRETLYNFIIRYAKMILDCYSHDSAKKWWEISMYFTFFTTLSDLIYSQTTPSIRLRQCMKRQGGNLNFHTRMKIHNEPKSRQKFFKNGFDLPSHFFWELFIISQICGLVSVLGFHVLPQWSAVSRWERTVYAFELFFQVVRLHVLAQGRKWLVFGGTKGTGVRFLTGVSANVHNQVSVSCASIWTEGALEGFLSGMSSQMNFQFIHLLALESTVWMRTGKGFASGMDLQMPTQMTFLFSW